MRLLATGVLAFRALSAAVLSKSDDIAEACSKTVMCSSSKLFESTMVQREVSPWVRKGFSVELPCPMCLGASGFKSPKFTSFRSFSRVCVGPSCVLPINQPASPSQFLCIAFINNRCLCVALSEAVSEHEPMVVVPAVSVSH
jgi:hypothetical protein